VLSVATAFSTKVSAERIATPSPPQQIQPRHKHVNQGHLKSEASLATICSSLNRLFLMGSSLSKNHLHRNYWSEETEQVSGARGGWCGGA
jgi:hypothetical protein